MIMKHVGHNDCTLNGSNLQSSLLAIFGWEEASIENCTNHAIKS